MICHYHVVVGMMILILFVSWYFELTWLAELAWLGGIAGYLLIIQSCTILWAGTEDDGDDDGGVVVMVMA